MPCLSNTQTLDFLPSPLHQLCACPTHALPLDSQTCECDLTASASHRLCACLPHTLPDSDYGCLISNLRTLIQSHCTSWVCVSVTTAAPSNAPAAPTWLQKVKLFSGPSLSGATYLTSVLALLGTVHNPQPLQVHLRAVTLADTVSLKGPTYLMLSFLLLLALCTASSKAFWAGPRNPCRPT